MTRICTAFVLLLCSQSAHAMQVADFSCCHFDRVDQKTSHPQRILVVPPKDARERVTRGSDPKGLLWMGTARGGYGNPFPLHGARPLGEMLAEAIEQALDALGHDAQVVAPGAPPADADLVITGSITQWQVDISSFGTRKLNVQVQLTGTKPGSSEPVWTSAIVISTHEMKTSPVLPAADLRKNAKAWYKKTRGRYLWAAAVESGLIQTIDNFLLPGTAAQKALLQKTP